MLSHSECSLPGHRQRMAPAASAVSAQLLPDAAPIQGHTNLHTAQVRVGVAHIKAPSVWVYTRICCSPSDPE